MNRKKVVLTVEDHKCSKFVLSLFALTALDCKWIGCMLQHSWILSAYIKVAYISTEKSTERLMYLRTIIPIRTLSRIHIQCIYAYLSYLLRQQHVFTFVLRVINTRAHVGIQSMDIAIVYE